MSERVIVVTDGRWPEDAGPDDFVVVVPSTANAGMWLAEGRPLEAFAALEGVLGFAAYSRLVDAGWPLALGPGDIKETPDADAALVRITLQRATAFMEKEGPELGVDSAAAVSALEALAMARQAISESDGADRKEALADIVARALLAGYAAPSLGVSPVAMQQPAPIQKAGGEARAQQRRLWWSAAARMAEAAAAENLNRSLAEIGRKVHAKLLKACEGEADAEGRPFKDIPKTPEKVAERLRQLGRDGELVWPDGSRAAETSPRASAK